MIILPDRTQPRGKVLMPMRLREWSPSDEHGHVPVHRWCVRARLNDGYIVRELWFDDRDEADAFLFAQVIGCAWPHYEPPAYPVTWQILVTVTLTTPLTAQSIYSKLGDYPVGGGGATWSVIGGGGYGNLHGAGGNGAAGAGGGFSQLSNVDIPTPTATYSIGAGAPAYNGFQGPNGGDTYFNGGSYAAAVLAAKGGGSAFVGGGSTALGGAAASGIGSLKRSGGNGGTCPAATSGAGGGGAGGQDADGVTGLNSGGAGTVAASGSAGNGGLNGGGAGGISRTNTPADPGGNGTNLAAAVGSGGGGGGCINSEGGKGGDYGGGTGGACSAGPGTARPGAQGVIFGSYTAGGAPLLTAFNLAMMGF